MSVTRTGLLLNGSGERSSAGLVDSREELVLSTEDGRVGETNGVRVLSLPLDVRDEDSTGAGSAESRLRHGSLEEKEGKVGVLVGGSVGGGDLAKADGGSSALVKLALGSAPNAVTVLNGLLNVVESRRAGVNENLANLGVGGLGSSGDGVNAVLLGSRVDRADGVAEGGNDIKDVVESENVLVAAEVGCASSLELVELAAEVGVGTGAVDSANGLQGRVNLRRRGGRARSRREALSSGNQRLDAVLDIGVRVELVKEGSATRRNSRGNEGRLLLAWLKCNGWSERVLSQRSGYGKIRRKMRPATATTLVDYAALCNVVNRPCSVYTTHTAEPNHATNPEPLTLRRHRERPPQN